MNVTQNQPPSSVPQRRYVSEYAVDNLPETWDRFTILDENATTKFALQLQDLNKQYIDGFLGLEFTGSKIDYFHQARKYAEAWAEKAVRDIHKCFMSHLGPNMAQLDTYSISTTIDQIVSFGTFLAFNARIGCTCLPSQLSDYHLDDLTRIVQKQIDKWLCLWIGEFREWAEPRRRKPLVELHGRNKPPTVNGVRKSKILAEAQFDVVKALLDAGMDGLTKDAIENVRSGARRTLTRLAKSDEDWESVILMPGSTGRHYRLRFG